MVLVFAGFCGRPFAVSVAPVLVAVVCCSLLGMLSFGDAGEDEGAVAIDSVDRARLEG